MRRPVPIAIGVVIAVLLVLGAAVPRRQLRPARRPGAARDGADSRQVADVHPRGLQRRTRRRRSRSWSTGLDGRRDRPTRSTLRRPRCRDLDGVARVDAATGATSSTARRCRRRTRRRSALAGGPSTWLTVVPAVEPCRPRARPWSATSATCGTGARSTCSVGGPPAQLVDAKAAIAARLPLAARPSSPSSRSSLLFLMFGSVLVPVKAIVLNVPQPDGDVRSDGLDLPGRPPAPGSSASPPPARSTRRRRS